MEVKYVIDESGQRTGVLLDVHVYQQLIDRKASDPELLTEMDRAELEALASARLALMDQSRLDELLALQKENSLSDEETAELEKLLEQVDQLTILKTRARYTLAQAADQHP